MKDGKYVVWFALFILLSMCKNGRIVNNPMIARQQCASEVAEKAQIDFLKESSSSIRIELTPEGMQNDPKKNFLVVTGVEAEADLVLLTQILEQYASERKKTVRLHSFVKHSSGHGCVERFDEIIGATGSR